MSGIIRMTTTIKSIITVNWRCTYNKLLQRQVAERLHFCPPMCSAVSQDRYSSALSWYVRHSRSPYHLRCTTNRIPGKTINWVHTVEHGYCTNDKVICSVYIWLSNYSNHSMHTLPCSDVSKRTTFHAQDLDKVQGLKRTNHINIITSMKLFLATSYLLSQLENVQCPHF